MAEQKKPTKVLHRTESSYSKTLVPKIEQPHHDIIAERLLSVLEPIGTYKANLSKLKGKAGKKRKCRQSPASPKPNDADVEPKKDSPPPAIRKYALIGFNEVTQHLEKLASQSNSQDDAQTSSSSTRPQQVSAVFLLRSMDDLIYSHLPALCHTATTAHPKSTPTRLVVLDESVEKRASAALGGISRVSVLAILETNEDVPGLDPLLKYVQEFVKPVEVPWLKEAMEGRWLGSKINSR